MASHRLAQNARLTNALGNLARPVGCICFVGLTGMAVWVVLQFIRLLVKFLVLVEGL